MERVSPIPDTPLTTESLSIPPKKLTKYEPGKGITRENFLNFLVQSFAISRGDREKQLKFFQWSQVHDGIALLPILRDFQKRGGYQIFWPAEREKFETAFERIPAHDATVRSISSGKKRQAKYAENLRMISKELDETIKDCLQKSDKTGPAALALRRASYRTMTFDEFKNYLHRETGEDGE